MSELVERLRDWVPVLDAVHSENAALALQEAAAEIERFQERIQELEAALREKDEIAADYHGFPDDEAEDSPARCVFLGGSGEACMACRIQALGGDCICGEINARHCPEHNEGSEG